MWHAKLGAGAYAEELVRRTLEEAGFAVWKNPATDKTSLLEWDLAIAMDGTVCTAEVKFDKMEAKTGNIAIEYHNTKQDRPSGILATKADLWIVVLDKPVTVWVCKTSDLLRWFEEAACHKTVVRCGDDNAAIKLYRRDIILPSIFHRIDDIAPKKRAELVRQLLDVQKNRGKIA